MTHHAPAVRHEIVAERPGDGAACALLVSPSPAVLHCLAAAVNTVHPRLPVEYLPSTTELLFRLVRPGRGTVLIHLDSVEDLFDGLPQLFHGLAPRWRVTLVGQATAAHTDLESLPAWLACQPAGLPS